MKDTTGDRRSARIRMAAKLTGLVLALAAAFFLIRMLPFNAWLEAALAWVDRLGPAAPAAFVGIYFVTTVLMLPAWPLSVAAGLIFGLVGGTLAVLAGATSGAAGAFVLARYFARGAVEAQLRRYPRFAAVDRAVAKDGWKIVLLLRLSPAFPFSLQNFAYGLTGIRFWPCMAATAVGILPGAFMYVYFGYAGRASLAAVQSGVPEDSLAEYVLLGLGLAATIAVTVYVTRLARRAIREHGELAMDPSQG